MKFSIIDTKKKLERLVLHLEQSADMTVIGSAKSIDQFISEQDKYILDSAFLTRSPEYAGYLLRLFKLSMGSKLDKKICEALGAIGEHVEEELLGLLDTQHGLRAANILAGMGSSRALRPITRLADSFEEYMTPAIKLCTAVGGDDAVSYLIDILKNNKPFGFPASLLKKDENQIRIVRTSIAIQALKKITGQNFQKSDEWLSWHENK